MPQSYFSSRIFQSLSLRDLLEARDRHHIRLATQYSNVVGTAVGFFRYRDSDDGATDPAAADEIHDLKLSTENEDVIARKHAERTLENSSVKRWSPPCVLVFVDRWLRPEEFRTSPELIIPSFLETADARLVPTCVILASRDDTLPSASDHLNFPANLYGGGYAAATDLQGRERVASFACLVTDGDLTYALTNRHVTGQTAGRPIYTYVGGERMPVGTSHDRSVGKVPSSKAYSKWPGQEAYSNIDAGLILVDNVHQWTTQVYGLGQLDEPVRLNFDSALETCVGLPVRAFGAASGALSGEIVALFYRYKSLGGYDFIADFLIGPRKDGGDAMRTLPGDSGTLWVVDQPTPSSENDGRRVAPWYRPIALQWGGQVTVGADGERKFHFALATSAETVCRLLEVDIVRNWNLGHPEYWGEMGHYAIGLKACGLISDASPKLRALLQKNSANIGFDDAILRDPNKYRKQHANYKNVPLADVPDNVWRNPTKYGGRMGRPEDATKNNDSSNHFADLDHPGVGKYHGKTLMKMFQHDPASLTIDTWAEFYELLQQHDESIRPGALPFRVWQAFNAMVDYLKSGDLAGFVCVAGIVAHYVGDASQPLHISRLHHGAYPVPNQGTVLYGVHSVYETTMLDNHSGDVVDGLNTRLSAASAKAKPTMTSGQDAGRAVVKFMIDTYHRLPPTKIIATYLTGHNEADRAKRLWDAHHGATLDNMAACCTFLASLWESAWKVAGAESKFSVGDMQELDYETELRATYRPQSFFPSVGLRDMKPYCT